MLPPLPETFFPWPSARFIPLPLSRLSARYLLSEAYPNCLFIYLFFKLFIYLTAPGLRCSRQILSCGTRDLVPWPGTEPRSPASGLVVDSEPLDHQGSPCVCVKSSQLCLTLCNPVDYIDHQNPWDSPGKNIGVDSHALLYGIFPPQGSNPHLLGLPALAGGFFTTSTTWEALGSPGLPI